MKDRMESPNNGGVDHEKTPHISEQTADNHDDSSYSVATEDHNNTEFEDVGASEEELAAADSDAAAKEEFRGKSLFKTLENNLQILGSARPKGTSLDIQNMKFRTRSISSIPYFPLEIRQKLINTVENFVEAANTFKRMQVAAESPTSPDNIAFDEIYPLLDDDYRLIVDKMPDEESKVRSASIFWKRQTEKDFYTLKTEALRLESNAIEVVMKAEKAIWRMQESVQETTVALNFLAGMSQGESTITRDSCGTETNDAILRQARIDNEGTSLAGETPQAVVELFECKSELNHEQFFCAKLTDTQTRTSYDNLKAVSQAWENWVLKSNIIPLGDKCAKSKVIKGIEWMSSCLKEEKLEESAEAWFPNVLSGEVNAAQPTLLGLLNFIGGCFKDCDTPCNQSPFKTRAKQNHIIPPSTRRKKRIADIGVLKPGRFQLLMKDYAMKLLVEIKPVFRKNMSPDSLDEESLQQTIGHLAKYLRQCLNFYGMGIPSFASGLTATLTHVKIAKLTLDLNEISAEGGGQMTSLRLAESTRLPLMTKKCFDQWVKKAKPEKEQGIIEKLRRSLYGENGGKGLDEDGVPLGLRLFWELIQKRHNELFGPDYESLFRGRQNNDIGHLLGSGSFSFVFGMKEKNHVLKLPRFHFLKHVEKEKSILEELARSSKTTKKFSPDIALPVVEAIREIKFMLGNVETVAQGLEMSPKGIPLVGYLQQSDNIDVSKLADKTWADICKALSYMHAKNVAHNDVSPYNLVLTGGDASRIILVDFNCACKLNDELFGFWGTPLFVHKDIFGKYPGKKWLPQEKYDFFGLVLTLCAILNDGKASWDVDGFPCSIQEEEKKFELNQKMEKRYQNAKQLITHSSSEYEKQWLDWLEDAQTSTLPGKRKRV